jgi:hypothetical protein
VSERRCRWPDGGCGKPISFVPTGNTHPDGRPVLAARDPDGGDHHATCAKFLARQQRLREEAAASEAAARPTLPGLSVEAETRRRRPGRWSG